MPQPSSSTQLLEAIALSGQHVSQCACGFLASSPDAEVVVDLVSSHACPAAPLDVITDRVFSIPGVIALIAVATVAFTLTSLF